MIRYSSLHCWGHSKRLVNPGKVVMHEVEGDRVTLVFNLLAKSVGQPGHPSHAHPHREILSLHKAG